MMKLMITLSVLLVTFQVEAMQGIPRRVVHRLEERVEMDDGSLITRYQEVGYTRENPQGEYVNIGRVDERNSVKNILYRNFIKSDTAKGGFTLLMASCLGLAGLEPQNDRIRAFNQTTMCPSPHYYTIEKIDSILNSGLWCLAGTGAALCCMQCIKAGKECCDACAENEEHHIH